MGDELLEFKVLRYCDNKCPAIRISSGGDVFCQRFGSGLKIINGGKRGSLLIRCGRCRDNKGFSFKFSHCLSCYGLINQIPEKTKCRIFNKLLEVKDFAPQRCEGCLGYEGFAIIED
ncbi:MAG: hypothetical protein QMD86_01460 [Patescibacteria group bacterium]|nr:hypothetical protein [Patescibacteria group bacterium]